MWSTIGAATSNLVGFWTTQTLDGAGAVADGWVRWRR